MKKTVIALLVGLLMVSVLVVPALAKADRQELVPYQPFGPIDPDASGKAIINRPKGDVVLVITVSVKGLEPEKSYLVKSFSSWNVDFTDIGTLITNKNGNGHFHINFREGDTLPPIGHIYINVDTDDPLYNNGMVLVDENFV